MDKSNESMNNQYPMSSTIINDLFTSFVQLEQDLTSFLNVSELEQSKNKSLNATSTKASKSSKSFNESERRQLNVIPPELQLLMEQLTVLSKKLSAKKEEAIKELTDFQVEKDEAIKQLADLQAKNILKDSQLKSQAELIQQLKAENDSKDSQLKFHAKSIERLQVENDSKDSQLESQAKSIQQLEAETDSKDSQLESQAELIKRLQTENDSKDSQLNSHVKLIEKLQVEKGDQDKKIHELQRENHLKNIKFSELEDKLTAAVARFRNFGEAIGDENRFYEALQKSMKECGEQKQYGEAIIHAANAIALEKSFDGGKPENLRNCFAAQARCHLALKQYQQAIDAANSSLSYHADFVPSLKFRAEAFFAIGNKASAAEDARKILDLKPDDQEALQIMERIQQDSNQ